MQAIGPYRILGEIARGGMGVVLRGEDPHLKREVAIKLLLAGAGATDHQRARFLREARTLARLRHPNVVAVYAAGEHEGQPYLVMDFVQGESLGDRIDRTGPLSSEQAIELGIALAGALQAAHAQGILHRDLKPDNVLIDGRGHPLLTDFGLAKDLNPEASGQLSKTGSFIGTPGFWPPEQAEGLLEEMGPASDVYGLGALLYAALTGRPPIVGNSMVEVMIATRDELPDPPSTVVDGIDPGLEEVLLRCLEKEPADRYGSAGELAEALQSCFEGGPRKPRRPTRRDLRAAVRIPGRAGELLDEAVAEGMDPRTVLVGLAVGALAIMILIAVVLMGKSGQERARVREQAKLQEELEAAEREKQRLKDELAKATAKTPSRPPTKRKPKPELEPKDTDFDAEWERSRKPKKPKSEPQPEPDAPKPKPVTPRPKPKPKMSEAEKAARDALLKQAPLPEPLAGETVFLEGRVRDAAGNPAAGVLIAPAWRNESDGTMQPGRYRDTVTARTDAAGRFRLPVLPRWVSGKGRNAWGCVIGLDRKQKGGFLIAVQATPVDVRLQPVGEVLGAFKSSLGGAVGKLQIRIDAIEPTEAGSIVWADTAENGAFRMRLPAGRYRFSCYLRSRFRSWTRVVRVPAGGKPLDLGPITLRASSRSRQVGGMAPEWRVTDAYWPKGMLPAGKDPKQVKLSDLRGKWVLLGFKSPLQYFRYQTRKFKAIADRYVLVRMDWRHDSLQSVFAQMRKFDALPEGQLPKWPVVLDSGRNFRAYRLRSFPSSVLIDPQGRIVEGGGQKLFEEVLPQLANNKTPTLSGWAVTGRVLDRRGKPAVGAVVARGWLDAGKRMVPKGTDRATTDSEGRFRFVVSSKRSPEWIGLVVLDSKQRYGAIARKVRRGAALKLKLKRLVTVKGRFVCKELGLVPQYELEAMTSGVGVAAASWRGDGAFRFRLPQGDYSLWCMAGLEYKSWGRSLKLRTRRRPLDLGEIDLAPTEIAKRYDRAPPPLTINDGVNLPAGVRAKRFRLSAYRGKWVLLQLGGFPGWRDVKRVFKQYGDVRDRFEVVVLMMMTKVKSVAEAERKYRFRARGVGYPVLLDHTNTTSKSLDLHRFPSFLLIDPAGNLKRGHALDNLRSRLYRLQKKSR